MPNAFKVSSHETPCPICGRPWERKVDQDCRIVEQGNLILCHTHIHDGNKAVTGYRYASPTKDNNWGVWLNDQRDAKGSLKGRKIRVGEKRSAFYYPDRDGNALVKVEKIKQGSDKSFYQYHWDGDKWVAGMPEEIRSKIPIYRYSEVRQAINQHRPVVIVEGETAADSLWDIEIAATTFIGGSKKLHSYGKNYKSDLEGADLILCPDRDRPGLEHMDEVSKIFPNAKLLRVYPKSPIWQCVPDTNGLDIEDWIQDGATAKEILSAIVDHSSQKREKSATELRKIVEEISEEPDIFSRTILEKDAASQYGVRGKVLDRLIDALEPPKPSTTVSLEELSSTIYAQIEERAESKVLPGYLSGFHDLDSILCGFQPSDLSIIAARPSMGKTAFALNIAKNIASKYSMPCLFFSLEMSTSQVHYRLLSMQCKISSQRLRTGNIYDKEWETLARSVGELSSIPLSIDDGSELTIEEMKSKCNEFRSKKGEIGMIAVDYLQLMSGNGENRNSEISKISRGLKGIARDFNVPVLALSQLSRSPESRTNKRPMLSDLRESGAIEQDADVAIMLYRDEYYNPESTDKGVTEVSVVKHRNGPVGTVRLLFDKESTRFENMLIDKGRGISYGY